MPKKSDSKKKTIEKQHENKAQTLCRDIIRCIISCTILPEYLCNRHSEIERIKNEPLRFCGAGHEMVSIDVDGKSYPCHRFLPLCTGKPAPSTPVNRQYQCKPDKCAQCKFIFSCPTCAGFNYKINGDTSIRTTFHCEAFQIGIQASCKLEALRLIKMKELNLKNLNEKEKEDLRNRVDGILNIIENGAQLN
jgi:radical SAM protein with 4Fe4S-binding SPASM domain